MTVVDPGNMQIIEPPANLCADASLLNNKFEFSFDFKLNQLNMNRLELQDSQSGSCLADMTIEITPSFEDT